MASTWSFAATLATFLLVGFLARAFAAAFFPWPADPRSCRRATTRCTTRCALTALGPEKPSTTTRAAPAEAAPPASARPRATRAGRRRTALLLAEPFDLETGGLCMFSRLLGGRDGK